MKHLVHYSDRRDRGVALILVLSILALLTVLILSFASIANYQGRSSRGFLRTVQTDFLVNMAINEAMFKIKAGTPRVGTNNYWVSAPGRIWRVGGVDVLGATNRLASTNLGNMEVSGYVDLFSTTNIGDTAAAAPSAGQIGFRVTNTFVNLNGPERGYRICPDPTPAGAGSSPVPLVVQWINVLKDPSRPAGPDNPVVGRYAYWVDVENARINVNDVGVTNRTGWRGLSPQEFDPEPVGLDATVLNTFRQPQATNIGSPNLPLTTYRNQAFFRRVEDLKSAEVEAGVIRSNAFYLTASGRDIEVDNAGRMPIELDKYNGVYDSTDASRNPTLPPAMGGASVSRNHPMAVWPFDLTDAPLLSGKNWNPGGSGGTPGSWDDTGDGPGNTQATTWADYQLWMNRRDQQAGGGPDNPLLSNLDPPICTWTDIVLDPELPDLNGDGTINEDDWLSVPGLEVAVTYVHHEETFTPPTSGGLGPTYVGANYYLFSDENRSTNSPDWLLPRFMGTYRDPNTWDSDAPLSTGFGNRFSSPAAWDRSVHHDIVAMQRLLQTANPATEPKWFVKSTAMDKNLAPAANASLSSSDGGGKYTWNEFAQLLANINTWRQTSVPMEAQGDVTIVGQPGPEYLTWPSKETIGNPIPAGISFGASEPVSIRRFSGGAQPIVLNQNLGNRPLPYVNEVGVSVYYSGGDIQRITLHLEMWNPAYVASGEEWHLGIVALLPEAPFGNGWNYMFTHPGGLQGQYGSSVYHQPPLALTNASLIGAGTDANRYGNDRNPERYRTWTYRTMSSVIPNFNASMAPVNWCGTIWKSPPENLSNPMAYDYFQIYGMRNANLQNDGVQIFPADAELSVQTNVLGGARMAFQNSTHANKSYYLNRWHVPVITDSGRFVVLRDAHLVDWRVPQRVDVSILPSEATYGNIGIVSDANLSEVAGAHERGRLRVLNDGSLGAGFRINTAVAVGLMKIQSGVVEVSRGTGVQDNFVSLAAGIRGNADNASRPYAPFYQITPQPRVNPLDDTGSGMANELYGIPQTKYLPFLNVKMSGGGPIYTASREVDDPRANTRTAFVDFSRTSSDEENNLENTYDANDWGPMLQDTVPTSLGSITELPIMSYTKGGTYIGAAELYETATGPILEKTSSGWATGATIWPGEVGATNSALTRVTTVNGWSTTGTNWNTTVGGAKPLFSGWGDGDGDLTSHLYKMNDFEHPAELGYVHTGRPWRTLRFGRSYYGTDPDENVRGAGWPQNTVDTTSSVPDWYVFDQFLGLSVAPDGVLQSRTELIRDAAFRGSSLGAVTNPRRGTMTLNPTLYTAGSPQGVPASQARLKPLYSMFSGVASGQTLTNLVQAVYMPTNALAGSYEGYLPGATGDRYGIPGVLDSPGELSEVFGRITNGTIIASAPYLEMATRVWGGTSPTLPSHSGDTSGAKDVFDAGWSEAGYNSGAVTLAAGASAFPKELLRAVGAQTSPRSRQFRVYIVSQVIQDKDGILDANDRVVSEAWREALIDRDNGFNESSAGVLTYRILWAKDL